MRAPKNAITLTMPSDREIVITRVFDAPRELVWQAMTDPQHVVHWWGPRGSTLAVCEIDFRPGGAWRFVLRDADGRDYRFKGVYHEIMPPERLVATECFDEPSLGSPEWLTTLDVGGARRRDDDEVQDSLQVGRGSRRASRVADEGRGGREL